MTPLIFVDLPYACFGLDVTPPGWLTVSGAPPIARWMVGKPVGQVFSWVSTKGGTCRWVAA